MILLKNSQKTLHLSTKTIKAQVQLLLSAAGYRDYDIGISFIGDRPVRKLNADYRGKDKSTDILSFPFKEAVKPGVLPAPQSDDDKNLGDIYISARYVDKWCKANGVDVHERLPVLYAHGICHLLGYDHEELSDYKKMKQKETKILKKMQDWQASLDGQPNSPRSKP
ncbi:hypothetical protein BG011_006175 [Mortierella polycephala]|uniref:Uncharacterized protein n=1 Tax=Mortierella polycephala TaxID=41804 RepID=A0A9P6QDK7_9FUNG|nr:hypothetical protein BG011_006175 [Mortierella polycephala]